MKASGMATMMSGAKPDARHHRRIGADHHHLAWRLLITPMAPVGDRKTERHQSRNRAEAEADGYFDEIEEVRGGVTSIIAGREC